MIVLYNLLHVRGSMLLQVLVKHSLIPIAGLHSSLSHVLIIRNVMVSPNATCYASHQNLMTGKIGWDCSYSLKTCAFGPKDPEIGAI